jgi:hypothetical protein
MLKQRLRWMYAGPSSRDNLHGRLPSVAGSGGRHWVFSRPINLLIRSTRSFSTSISVFYQKARAVLVIVQPQYGTELDLIEFFGVCF